MEIKNLKDLKVALNSVEDAYLERVGMVCGDDGHCLGVLFDDEVMADDYFAVPEGYEGRSLSGNALAIAIWKVAPVMSSLSRYFERVMECGVADTLSEDLSEGEFIGVDK